MTRNCWIWVLLGSAACGFEDDATTASTEQALYGAEGDYEFAIDAPWRIEPTMPGLDYDAIPITITINDAYFKVDNALEYIGPAVWQAGLGQVKALTVTEHGVGTFDIPLAHLHEVERVIGPWHVSGGPDPQHQLCRRWAGEDCAGSDIMVLTETSEWHATVFYKPHGLQTPGSDVRLDFALTVSQVNRAQTPVPYPLPKPDHVFENQVSVHLGEAPLPRFDDTTWAYGDLHYHSQGTDNEGESGYGYRSVVHAMAALGLDFALASEHASDSEQMNDLDIDVGSVFTGIESFDGDLLRDMNDARYGHLWHWLQDQGGANRVLTAQRHATPSRLRVPQIFLGGEVDVVPETPAGSYVIDYGNGLHYDILSACDREPDAPFVLANCDPQTVKQDTGDGRWIVRDPQSRTMAAARQHMLYLPHFATGDSGFISSSTTKYGGGRFRLRDLVRANFELNDQGDFFLAHPLDVPSSDQGAIASLGPDIVPYSQAQYDDIFGSQHFRGLQLWNSDTRRKIDASFGINHLRLWNGANSTWETAPAEPEVFGELHHGAATWDRLLLAGMDPARTSGISWLAPGEPRKLFMAGGSDAHGDLNFRRAGYMVIAPLNDDIDKITDTAMGTPRNLVHAGAPQGTPLADGIESRPFTQDQVFAAMARGEFAVTDGPALRILWDTNRNGDIDDTDVPMGGAIAFDPQAGLPPLIVDWKSTTEFGELDRIDLYVGAASGARGVVYAPAQHGVRQSAPFGVPATAYRDETTGKSITLLDDGYWQASDLRVPIPFGHEKVGRTVIQLRMSDFRVGTKGSRV
ncbi:MAG: hypothetical protein ABI867_22635, partial [Kofleriaceae bacterium]